MAADAFPARQPLWRLRGPRLLLALASSIGLHIAVGSTVPMQNAANQKVFPTLSSSIVVSLELDRVTTHGVDAPASRVIVPTAEAIPSDTPRAASKRAARRPPSRGPAEKPESAANADITVPALASMQSARGDEHYYSAHELDVYPRLRQPLAGEFTIPGGAAGLRFLVAVALDQAGTVEEVSLLEGDGDAVVIAGALRRAGFYPASKDGRPVKSRVVIEIE